MQEKQDHDDDDIQKKSKEFYKSVFNSDAKPEVGPLILFE